MRVAILLIGFIVCSFNHIYSQGLMVTYEETNTVSLPLPQIDDPRIRNNPQVLAVIENNRRNMNRSTSGTSQLMISNGTSTYKRVESKQPDSNRVESGEGAARGVTTFQLLNVSPHTIYKNHHDMLMISQANFDKEEYLIEESLSEFKWKIGRKREMVSGYQCIEATAKAANGAKITAWYTPDIPVNDGPSVYCGLPGLILYLDVSSDNGKRIFSCTSIEQISDLPVIDAPDRGEKISREQYNKIVTERASSRGNINNNRSEERGNNSTRRSGTTIIR